MEFTERSLESAKYACDPVITTQKSLGASPTLEMEPNQVTIRNHMLATPAIPI